MKKTTKSILLVLTLYFSWILYILPLTSMGLNSLIKSLNLDLNVYFIGILIPPISYLIMFTIYKIIIGKTSFKEALRFDKIKKNDLVGIPLMIGCIAINIFITFIVNTVFSNSNIAERANNVEALMSIPFGIALLLGGIFIPYIEELVFRKAIFNLLKECKPTVFYILSSLIFASIHWQNPENPAKAIGILISTFLSGYYFALMYNRNKTIWMSFLAHASYNSFVLLLQYFIIK